MLTALALRSENRAIMKTSFVKGQPLIMEDRRWVYLTVVAVMAFLGLTYQSWHAFYNKHPYTTFNADHRSNSAQHAAALDLKQNLMANMSADGSVLWQPSEQALSTKKTLTAKPKPRTIKKQSKKKLNKPNTSMIKVQTKTPGFSDQHVFHQGLFVSKRVMAKNDVFEALLKKAKTYHIDTLIIDFYSIPNEHDQNQIRKMHAYKMHVIPRIEIFPKGGSKEQVHNPNFWKRQWPLMKAAIDLGASAIQLDYIRYAARTKADKEKVHHIHKVIKWYKNKVKPFDVPLQMVVFGIVAYKPTHTIGQDIEVFADTIDAFCPTLYPSHFKPYVNHAMQPYKTVYQALIRMHQRLDPGKKPLIFAYIEPNNFRYRHKHRDLVHYIHQQILASRDAKANGWYAWSINGYYHNLFNALHCEALKDSEETKVCLDGK
jgi:hypothetical protein